MSALGSALGFNEGFIRSGNTHVHVATGDIFSTFDPYANVDFFSPQSREDYRVWLMSVGISATDATDFGNTRQGLEYSAISATPGFTSSTQLVARYTGVSAALTSGGLFGGVGVGGQANNPMAVPLPLYIPVGTECQEASTSDTGGTVTIVFNWVFWMGPRGLTPPGGY